MFNKKPEVLVVGAGPVGLFTALSLAKKGTRVQILDTGARACSHSYALGLHPQTLKLLQEAGLLGPVLAHAYPIWRIGLFDANGRRAHIALDRPDEYACLAVLPQNRLEEALEQALLDEGLQVDWRHEAANIVDTEDGVRVTINQLESESRGFVLAREECTVARSADITVPFVIGADGHNSQVRRAINLEFPELGPAQHYAVFEFKTDADLDHELRIVLGDGTTDVLWPLPDGRCRWSFQLTDDPGRFGLKRAKERETHSEWGYLPQVSEESIAGLLEERAPWFEGSVEKFAWRTLVRFERRLVPRFGQGRVWLAGDAAHVTGPVGVQSMNMGMLEGHDLALAMERILNEAASLDYLEGYNEVWTRRWRQLQGLAAHLGLVLNSVRAQASAL
jgi:2-polyprenyl-6-methoxyphenol hydroxylase-like FAD-dependent oxidoreductase